MRLGARARLVTTAMLFAAASAGPEPADAQEVPRPLPVTATLLFNALYYESPSGLEGGSLLNGRFAGRLGVRLTPRLVVGVAVGSWQRGGATCLKSAGCDELDERAILVDHQAVVFQVYGQAAPLASAPFFIRAGVGLGHTSTLRPAGSYMSLATNAYFGISAGAGADLRVAPHLYVTPSIDVTTMPGVDAGSDDLRSALALGIGLTIR